MTNLEWLKGVIAMTNLEWIRTLDVDRMASVLDGNCAFCDCKHCAYDSHKDNCIPEGSCHKGIKLWLNAEHTPKIKPCPVCKGKMSIESNHGCYLVCPDCGLHFGIDAEAAEQGIIEGGYSTREVLVDAWNLILDTES